jgi:excisionase family DNA binding protein
MAKQPSTYDEVLSRIEGLISHTQLSHKKALTLKEAATYSGRSISNLYKLTSSSEIPHYKPEGKYIYFDREELENWMLRNPVRTAAEIEAEAITRVVLGRKGGSRR